MMIVTGNKKLPCVVICDDVVSVLKDCRDLLYYLYRMLECEQGDSFCFLLY